MLNNREMPQLASTIRRIVDDGLVPGAAVAWQKAGEPIRYDCAGETGFHSGRAIDERSLFRIFSMTKPITGIATMMLVEAGKIGLDQPLREILPAFGEMRVAVDEHLVETRDVAQPITIRHLLTHTAGLGYHNGGDAMGRLFHKHGLTPGTRDRIRGPGEMSEPTTLEEMGNRLAKLPLVTDPGTRFQYGIATDLLGLVIQTVCGMKFEEFLQERLFDPLGMPDTGFLIPHSKLDRLTGLYERRGATWKLVDDPRNSVYAQSALPSGGGGLISTAHDYGRFASMLANEGEIDGSRLLKPETVRLARSNLLPPPVDHIELPMGYTWPGTGFGAAMSVQLVDGDAPKGVFGWPGAAGTASWIDPERRFFLVFLVQYWPPEINISMRSEVIRAAYRDLERS